MNELLRDEQTLEKIIKWEKDFFAHERTDLEYSYHKWLEWAFSKIGPSKQQRLLSQMDAMIIHIQAWMQNGRSNLEARNRILQHARVFQAEIETIEDLQVLPLDQLSFIAEQLMAKQRLLALGQGGLTGMGGAFLLAVDLPAMVAVNIKSIQQLALVYGYDLNHPVEMVIALKLFHVATLPKAFQKDAWNQLFKDLEDHRGDTFFYQGKDEIIEAEWLQRLLLQMGKNLVVTMLKKKLIQGVPLIGMAFGAGINYRFAQQTIEVAQAFYQKRLISERSE